MYHFANEKERQILLKEKRTELALKKSNKIKSHNFIRSNREKSSIACDQFDITKKKHILSGSISYFDNFRK